MTAPPGLQIPRALQVTIRAWFGEAGAEWLLELPETVARLSRQWQLVLGATLRGGPSSLVLTATTSPVGQAVLKIPYPDSESRFEFAALCAYGGDGAVLAHRFDPESGGILMERITPGQSIASMPDHRIALRTACALLTRLRRPAPQVPGIPTAASLLDDWLEAVSGRREMLLRRWPSLPLAEVEQSLPRLRAEVAENLLVNRDAHLGNILSATREPWLLIDPKPVVGDRAFDGGFLTLDSLKRLSDHSPAAIAALLELIAEGLGTSSLAVRSWAMFRAVENVTWALGVMADPEVWALEAILLAAR